MLEECVAEISDEIEVRQTQEPSPKRPRLSILNCFSEILEQSGFGMARDDAYATVSEVDQYLREPLIPFHQSNSFTWWKENRHRFIQSSQLAIRYLSAPSTLVASERLFSVAGDIYDKRINCVNNSVNLVS